MLYTIGEIATLLNVPTSTLRFYDKKGLLPFVERSSGGKRIFKDADYECLQIIECLKESGMSINDIKEFITLTMQGDRTIDDRLQLFQKRKQEVEKQIAELNTTLETLDYKCWYYETAKAAGTTSVPEQMDIEEVPAQFHSIRKRLKNQLPTP